MKIYVIGLGPGDRDRLTPQAAAAIEKSGCVVGYDRYIEMISGMIRGKKIFSTPMRGEIQRCEKALEYALEGNDVAVVSSGDAGIYGMAGLVCEVCAAHPEVDIEVIPGITAACGAAALAGAPISNDFAVISLSDLLTPWEDIEKRLRLAARGDFVICVYNPASKKRPEHLSRACEYILEERSPETPCVYAENIGREGEKYTICTLAELKEVKVNMFTTVIIGNSKTEVINGRLVTKRGYRTA